MSQTMNSAPKNVPEQRTYKVEDIAVMLNIGRTSAYSLVKEDISKLYGLVMPYEFPKNHLTNG